MRKFAGYRITYGNFDPKDFPRTKRDDWVVAEMLEHQYHREKFYNDAERLLPEKLKKEFNSLDFSHIRKDNRNNANRDIENILTPLGWEKGVDIGEIKESKIDFFKDKIGIEVQFRQATNLLHDVLKLQKGYALGRLEGGIIMTFDESVQICGENGQDSSFQSLDKWLAEFNKVISFTIPIWSIGLKH